MSKHIAKAHYLGMPGYTRLNCGQAIISAFKDSFALSQDYIQQFADLGGGRAPEGHCAAYYAVKCILENRIPEKLKECTNAFIASAGSTKCKDIRGSRKLSCVGCVEQAAQCLEDCI